ncbi:unnamed protein product [Cuscuta campestris]|uniref:Uncharacterized protein n=1 Tax=Cuscuta campestris TaxID=132261 RepID=A0A484LD23_9ASTE|nr:unnamed protein product [Cuscuta campestris]
MKYSKTIEEERSSPVYSSKTEAQMFLESIQLIKEIVMPFLELKYDFLDGITVVSPLNPKPHKTIIVLHCIVQTSHQTINGFQVVVKDENTLRCIIELH